MAQATTSSVLLSLQALLGLPLLARLLVNLAHPGNGVLLF
jgi:hypothetical protein